MHEGPRTLRPGALVKGRSGLLGLPEDRSDLIDLGEQLVGDGLGHFFGALRIDGFRPAAEFKAHMDRWIRRFREAEPIDPDQPVLVPGDPEREIEKQRRSAGIPLHAAVIADLSKVAEKFDLKL